MFLNSRFTIAGMRLRNPLKTYHDAALTLRSGARGGPRKTVRGWSQTAAVTQSKASWNSPTPVPAAVTLRSGTLCSPRQTDSGVFDRPPQAFDVGDFAFRHFFGEQIEHFLLNIDGINKALCAR